MYQMLSPLLTSAVMMSFLGKPDNLNRLWEFLLAFKNGDFSKYEKNKIWYIKSGLYANFFARSAGATQVFVAQAKQL